jgi:HEAT repeat protein
MPVMNTISINKKERSQHEFPPVTLQQLHHLIRAKGYIEHVKAKKELVKEGKKVLPFLYELLRSDSKTIRKEAMKIIELIAHKTSIPSAIKMLEDPESDVRWMAAVTLIKIGRKSIRPLLEALVSNSKSYFLRQGAHHVLSKLLSANDPKELKQLVKLIRHDSNVTEPVPVKAANALDKTRRK